MTLLVCREHPLELLPVPIDAEGALLAGGSEKRLLIARQRGV